MKRQIITIMAIATLAACQSASDNSISEQMALMTPKQATQPMLVSGINSSLSGSEYTALCDTVMHKAIADFTALESDQSPATLQSVVGKFDQITYDLQVIRQSWYMKAVHPDEVVRDAATKCSERYSDFSSQVSLSRGYYDRLAAIDLNGLSKTEKYMLEQGLKSFRREGVDKDQETRHRIRALHKEITEIGNQFDKNIRSDVRYVTTTADKLAGLPQDYLNERPADENGNIQISTDYPDTGPVFKYADNDDLRKQLRIASRSRGYPQNVDILKKLLRKRYELAIILGFENFAALSMDDKMIGSPENANRFLTTVGEALDGPIEKEVKTLLARLKKIEPEAIEVNAWQVSYLMNLIRQEDYALDSKEVRQYFRYDKVRDGILGMTEDLFGVDIRKWDTTTWHEDVETYEIVENGKIIGRFYMDNHPRENKYKHAAHWGLRAGIKDQQIALSGLAQNFPKGLMEHNQVETFLHEFGHLLHNVFSGNQRWFAITGMSMERDFVEAPSQMLEEWIWDYDTIKNFATNDNGEAIPKALVDKMVSARDFGLATSTATQIYYANLSLNYYDRDPDSFELESTMLELAKKFSPFPHVEGTHFYTNFGHLNGYSSNYYTYQWSLAIATDLFSKFEHNGMRNKAVAKEYREKVLAAAGSKPATEFVEDFLGRPFSANAYIEKLKSL